MLARSKQRARTVVLDDPTSPDGKRWIMSYKDWREERYKVAVAARFMCQGCARPHPAPFNEFHHSHHRFGRGGGKHEDRILIPLQRTESEPNLARWRWRRNLLWTCPIGHERLEKISTKVFRQSIKDQICECGLMKL